MANRWWSGGVDLTSSSSSMMMKRDLGISSNPDLTIEISNADDDRHNDDSEKEQSDEPREGAVVVPTRRARGRPPGSKNKPKPPIFVTRDSPNALRSHVLEVSGGSDIAECIAHYSRRRQRGVCVLSANGTVTNVKIRQPSAPGSVMALHGSFEILSLTGSFLPGPAPPGSTGLTVYLAAGRGEVVGGTVVGSLIAVGQVMVIASTFANATYERLPVEDEEAAAAAAAANDNNNNNNQSSGGDGGGDPSLEAAYNMQNLLNNESLGWRH
ncbi:hypothetical protein M569_08925, partial [Genlisea aurea]